MRVMLKCDQNLGRRVGLRHVVPTNVFVLLIKTNIESNPVYLSPVSTRRSLSQSERTEINIWALRVRCGEAESDEGELLHCMYRTACGVWASERSITSTLLLPIHLSPCNKLWLMTSLLVYWSLCAVGIIHASTYCSSWSLQKSGWSV